MDVSRCPKCGSTQITTQLIVDGEARCGACGWVGRNRELLVETTQLTELDRLRAEQRMVNDLRNLMSSRGVDFVLFLKRYGFITEAMEADKNKLAQYIAKYFQAMAAGMMDAVSKTNAEIDKELHGVKPS